MKKQTISLGLCLFAALLFGSCSGDKQSQKSTSANAQTAGIDTVKAQPPLAKSDRYYVLDRKQKTIYQIDLNKDSITQRFIVADDVVAIAYDIKKEWVYEAVVNPKPCLKVFDPQTSKTIHTFDFDQPPSDVLFSPIKRQLYVTSEDSSYFRIYLPDSMKLQYNYPLWIQGGRPIGPRTMSPGPSGSIFTANGARGSVTKLTTVGNYAYQTITINGAKFIDNAVSAFDGYSSLACDRKQGVIYRVEFGTGKMLARKEGLDNPRLIQLEVNSNTAVLVVGKTTVLMLNADSFAETGKVDLADYGDEIMTLLIPPKSNYAELTMDFKGVTRWLRFDIRNWELMRMVELY